MVDAGNFDASRLCKPYGSWAWKGDHSDAQPWRRSSIVEQGSGAIQRTIRFVPFNGYFSKSKDLTIEDDFAQERPAILWQLITVARGAFANGDEPPASREATDDGMDENDTAKPFIERCLFKDPDANPAVLRD